MKPWLYLPSEWAHDLSPFFLPLISMKYPSAVPVWRQKQWRGMYFPNPMGIAGGVDKNGELIPSWLRLGCGFIEIGTVTPLPQSPNPGKIMDRDVRSQALWNKMGFPSMGTELVHQRIAKTIHQCHNNQVPIFINIGKNRSTTNENAAQDYIQLMESFNDQANAFVVNISSPNTNGLRDLLKPLNLRHFLQPICNHRLKLRPPNSPKLSSQTLATLRSDPKFQSTLREGLPPNLARNSNKTQAPSPQIPLLLKLSPDMEDDSLFSALDTAIDCGIDGFILTNTTLDRPHGTMFPTDGGMSGKPLAVKSKTILQKTIQHLGCKKNDLLVISAGGIMTPNDVFERLNLGADLVQIYSALIYHGPSIFRDTARKALQQE